MLVFGSERKEQSPEFPDKEPEPLRRSVSMLRTMNTQKRMRLLSESNLDEVMDWHLKEGYAYHFISSGDVDSLTYLRRIVKEQHLDYCGIVTWVMAKEDALEIAGWVQKGYIDRVDFYIGEIFQEVSRGRGIKKILDQTARSCGGRVCRFWTHAKLVFAYGDKYDFAIESSANINTNPRTEQTCITVSTDLAGFYKGYFDEATPLDPGYEGWKPWHVQ